MKRVRNSFRGCLIGGAIGDALGWPVEFLNLEEIKRRYGARGIDKLLISTSGKANVTDDTQMALFTAEGILRAENTNRKKEVCDSTSVVFDSYQRWLLTQGYPKIKEKEHIYDGWLIKQKELYSRKAFGDSCLIELLNGQKGCVSDPINRCKGCGGIMRVAPAGLFYDKDEAFKFAMDYAAITHGHPSGYLSAGALAYLIALLIEGNEIEPAVDNTLLKLESFENHEEITQYIEKARILFRDDIPKEEAIPLIGSGWTGGEALGISIYCALKYKDDLRAAMLASVNHSGDSDSIGKITGNILGAYYGIKEIPLSWIENIELKDVVLQMADDLLIGYQKDMEWNTRYPVH